MLVSRRSLLRFGAATGALALWPRLGRVLRGDVTAWPAPVKQVVTQVFSLVGSPAPDGVMVSSMVLNIASVGLAVSESPDLSDATLVGTSAVDTDHLVKHEVTNLTPATQYYARSATANGAMFGETIRFKTLPAATGAWSLNIMLGSCQTNQSASITDLAWQDIVAWQPDMLMHLGDWGYWGGFISGTDPYAKDLDRYHKSMVSLSTMRHALEGAVLGAITISDHELSNNGDPRGGIFNSPETMREIIAFQKLMPIRDYGDTRQPRRGRYYSYDIGSTVKVIVTDFRTPDRSNTTDRDGPDKTMFGQAQLGWLLDQLDQTKVNLVVNETAWLATPYPKNTGPRRADKPWNYYHEQQIIADHITANSIRVVWLGGDRHLVGYLSGANNTLGGFPCWIGSGWEKSGLRLDDGEVYDWEYGSDPSSQRLVIGYVRLTLSDDGAGHVSLSGVGRAADTSGPQATWALSDVGSATDSWTLNS